MVRPACFDMNGIKSGVWSKEEDDTLRAFVQKHGHHNWQKLPFLAGLKRSGKSCRLRWVNYLQPGLNKSNFSKKEKGLIIKLHNQLGNKWAAIAEKLHGRTDNDIKNHWHAHIKKHGKRTRSKMGVHEEKSFEMNCCKKSNNHQQETTNVEAQEDLWAEAFDQRFFSNPFPEEEFNDFVQRHNGTPTFANSSNDGITYNDHIDLPTLIPEEEFFEFGLGHNSDTPTFSDSSVDGGRITYDERACFNQLYIDLPSFAENDLYNDFGLCYNDTPNFNVNFSPLIPEEEFSTFGLCYNDTPTLSDSSNGGITYDHNHTCFDQISIDLPLLYSEEEFSGFGLSHNGTPTFSDSSDGGLFTCFSQLNVDLHQFSEDEFNDLGLCYSDGTPTFSDSSDGSGIAYEHDTCFSQLNNVVLTPFPEEEFYDLGLCYNDTPNFCGITSSDSILENQNEVFGLNNLERIWYFGDDV